MFFSSVLSYDSSNVTAFQMISRPSPVGQLISVPNEIIKQKLYKIDDDDKYCPLVGINHLDENETCDKLIRECMIGKMRN